LDELAQSIDNLMNEIEKICTYN